MISEDTEAGYLFNRLVFVPARNNIEGMRTILCLFIIFISISPLWAQDLSTPRNGNLYGETESPFHPDRMTVFEAGSWQNPNIELKDGRLIQRNTDENIPAIENRTANTDILWIDDSTYIVLTGETTSYPHGILGDRIESTGFAVYKGEHPLVEYELPEGRVFETLRPLIADIIPENPGTEIILTSSDKNEGARIDVYSQEGELLGSSRPIGRAYRWLHVIGVASFDETEKKFIARVRTPHIGGILELLSWDGDALNIEASLAGVSTHTIGSDNLNMALILGTIDADDTEIFLPSSDFRSLLVIRYKNGRLRETRRFNLPDRLTSNIHLEEGYTASLWMATADGSIVRIHE